MKKTLQIVLVAMLLMELAMPSAFADTWDGSAVEWTNGSGTEADPYLIESAANLAWLLEMVNGQVSNYDGIFFKLTTDIDLNNISWIGIGTDENVSFQGSFDGDGHHIIGISTTKALFNYINGATIKNLSTSGTAKNSGIIAQTYGTVLIDNCGSTVNCSAVEAGGIIGYNHDKAIINNCYNAGTISGTTTAGGIIGKSSRCIVVNCYNSGTISSGSSTSNNTSYGGGIVGYMMNLNNKIERCYNSGQISGYLSSSSAYTDYAGGIVGFGQYLTDSVINCYNTGDISSTRGSFGIYGTNTSSTSMRVTNCYNIGNVVNRLYGSTFAISQYNTNCYYLEGCVINNNNGSGATSKSEAIMKSAAMPVLLNTDDEIFVMDITPNVNGGYPIFRDAIYVVTTEAEDVSFMTVSLKGTCYVLGEQADVQGFEYKSILSSSYNTVYANIGTTFNYELANLVPGTIYSYRAFVSKNGLTRYGEWKEFTTLSCSNTLNSTINIPSTVICQGDSVTYVAFGSSAYSEHFEYRWSSGESTASITTTVGGTYTVTISDDNGCSAIDSVTLTVNPLPVGSISGRTSICSGNSTTLTASGANSYTWSTGATTPTLTTSTAGTYTCTFRNSYGCTSTQDVTVSVFTAPTITGTTAICSGNSTTLTASGADSYLWNNGATTPSITVSEAGTYTVMGSTADGCSGSAGVTVNVEALPTIAINGDNTFCQGSSTSLNATGGETYTWGNGITGGSITVSTPGTYTVTGTNASGCSNTASIAVTAKPSYVNLPVLAAICEGEAFNFFGTMLSTAGTYDQSGFTTAGCDSTVTLTLSVNPRPTATISGGTSFCDGESTTLVATGGVSYLWNNGIATQNNTVSNAGTYTVTVTDINGCTGTASQTVTVKALPTITISGNTSFCEGGSSILTAQGGTSYLWSNGSSNAAINVNTSGNYSVVGTGDNGCTNTAVAVVTVNPMPTITINGNTSFCQGGSTTLTASGADTYTWSNGTNTPSVTINAFGVYNVTGTTAAGCTGSASVTVTVSPNPTITITGDTELCPGETTALTANGGTSYMWFDGTTNATYQTSSAGNYTVIGYNDAGCYSMVSVDVQQYDNAQSEETATGYGEYVWNGNVYTESGDYTFETVTEHGCDSTVTLHLTIEENGQGIDDIADEDVRIYSRGSEIVIEAPENTDALIYDVMGRIIHKGRIETPIHVNAAGVYMVKIANRQPQKVVVR